MKISRGNRKLPKDTLILNITSATDCPSKALGLCKIPHKCYAMKAERMYPACLPYRRAQAVYWDTHAAEAIAHDILQVVQHSRQETKYLRVSEAGDFKSQVDVDKLFAIATYLQPSGIVVYAYTARRDLNFTLAPDNCVLQGSGFMIHNSFTAVPKEEFATAKIKCPGDCGKCGLCKHKLYNEIYVKEH